MSAFTKHPSETYPIGVDYAAEVPEGAVLVSGLWSAVDENSGLDASADVLQVLPAIIDGYIAKCRVLGGELGHVYRLEVTVTFDTGDVLHDDVVMIVNQTG